MSKSASTQTVKRRVNEPLSLLLGVGLMVFCSAVAATISVAISETAGMATGILLPMVLYIAAIYWGGLRMVIGLIIGASAAVVMAMTAYPALRVILGDDAGEIPVEEVSVHPEAVSFRFAEAVTRSELLGVFQDRSGRSRSTYYAFPLVSEEWQGSEPIHVWVATRDRPPEPELLLLRAGIRVLEEDEGSYRHATTDAEERYGLASARDSIIVELVESRQAYISELQAIAVTSFSVFLGLWFVTWLLAWLVGRTSREADGPEGTSPARTTELGLGRTWITLFITSVLCLGFVAFAALAVLDGAFWFAGIVVSDHLKAATIVVAILASIIIPQVVLWWRQRRRAWLSWDSSGVTEWDGGGVRTAIPWSEVHHFIDRHPERPDGSPAWLDIHLTDGTRRHIVAYNVVPLGTSGARRRIVAKSLEKLELLASEVEERSQGSTTKVSSGDLDSHRPAKKSLIMLASAALSYAGLVFTFSWTPFRVLDSQTYLIPLVVSLLTFLACMVRASRPWRELRSLHLEGRRTKGAVHVELMSNAGTRLTVRDKTGKELEVETERLSHRDAAIHKRRGGAWLILAEEAHDSNAPYRGGEVPLEARALETDGVGAARKTRRRAVVVELAARLALAMIPLLFFASLAIYSGAIGDFELATKNDEGQGNRLDQARLLYERSCTERHTAACARLAIMLREGLGGPEDATGARQMFESACYDGDRNACLSLARMLDAGTTDGERARELYTQACSEVHPNACTALGIMYEEGRGGPQSDEVAAAYFQRGCDRSDAQACADLGLMYVQGQGVVRNLDRGRAFLQQACHRGIQSACRPASDR